MKGGRLAGARAAAAQALKTPRPTGALAATLGSRPGEAIVIPRTAIAGWMTLVGRAETFRVRAETLRTFLEAGYTPEQLAMKTGDLLHDWNTEIAVRTLALGIRSPEDHGQPLDSVEAWRADVDDEQIAALWVDYQDFVDRHDPIGSEGPPLEEHELAQLEAAAKKKGRRSLEVVRLTEAGPLRDYFGRPAAELTETEVWIWTIAHGAAVAKIRKLARDAAKGGTAASNPLDKRRNRT